MVLEGALTIPAGTSIAQNVESGVTGRRFIVRSQNRTGSQKKWTGITEPYFSMGSNTGDEPLKAGSSEEEDSSDEEAMNVLMEPQSSSSDQRLMVKRGVDGQKIPKNSRHNEKGHVPIRSLLITASRSATIMKKGKKVQKKRSVERKKDKQTRSCSLEVDWSKNFDVIRALTNASIRMSFEQLWQWDAVSAWRVLDCLFGRGKLMLGVVEEFDGEDEQDEEEKCLDVMVVIVHRTDLIALMDSGATSNVLFSAVVKRLTLDLERSKKNGDGRRRKQVASERKSSESTPIARLVGLEDGFYYYVQYPVQPRDWSFDTETTRWCARLPDERSST